MSAFINLNTLEYPRHAGDIELDPNGEYAPVIWVDPPEYNDAREFAYEGPPEQKNGEWHMTWLVRDLTAEEMANRDAVLAANRGDIDASGAAPDVVG